jgi:Transposase, Mutator family
LRPPFGIEIGVRLQPKRAFDVVRNGRSTSPKYATGQREVLGLDVGPSEDGAFWLRFLRGLVARGLTGVQLVTSDSHQGLKGAIAAVLQGASWQRCRTH